jgi:hypothetical protein
LVVADVPCQTPVVPKENSFDDPVAARYDETSAEPFAPDVVDPAVISLSLPEFSAQP